MKDKRPFEEKGQDIIEYALLLSIIASLGFFIYSQHFMISSIQTVFNQTESLMETGARRSSPDYKLFLDSISTAIRSRTLFLKENEYIYSGTKAGDTLAKQLGIPYDEGDAWSIGRVTNAKTDTYLLVIYSAAANDNYPISKRETEWEVYGPGGSKLASHGAPLPVIPVTKYGFKAFTGEENNEYARGSSVFGRGKEAMVVKGPEGRNTVR